MKLTISPKSLCLLLVIAFCSSCSGTSPKNSETPTAADSTQVAASPEVKTMEDTVKAEKEQPDFVYIQELEILDADVRWALCDVVLQDLKKEKYNKKHTSLNVLFYHGSQLGESIMQVSAGEQKAEETTSATQEETDEVVRGYLNLSGYRFTLISPAPYNDEGRYVISKKENGKPLALRFVPESEEEEDEHPSVEEFPTWRFLLTRDGADILFRDPEKPNHWKW